MSFWRNYYHITWATKNREHLILPSFESQLFTYIVNKGNELGVIIYAINGWLDHIHLLIAIPPKLSVAEVVRRLKGASAHYVNHILRPEDLDFAWQRGYGCFTLGESQRNIAEEYILNQKQHHADQTINNWLEQCTDLDEGPPDEGLPAKEIMRIVREQQEDYGFGDFPF